MSICPGLLAKPSQSQIHSNERAEKVHSSQPNFLECCHFQILLKNHPCPSKTCSWPYQFIVGNC